MRLCHIVPSLEEQHGGPSKSAYQLAHALARLEHEVDLFATHPVAAEACDDGRLHMRVLRRNWPQGICRSTGLRDWLHSARYDIIHNHALWLRPLHYAHQCAAASGSKLVISPRGMMSPWAWRHHGLRKWFARQFIHPGAFAAASGWHATSKEEAADIRALGFAQPVCVAPNGVSLPPVEEIIAARAHWHKACPASAARPVALFYSRFHRKKRVLELIDLWLARAPRDWLLLLVGIPQDYTPAELDSYVQHASGTGRIEVYNGVGQPPPYAVASLFLLPSHSENFGLVIAEAMAHGVPALVTDTTPWSRLNDEERGWCVPWDSFGRALEDAIAEGPARLGERGARARAWVLCEFSWDKSARDLAAFYQQLQDSRP